MDTIAAEISRKHSKSLDNVGFKVLLTTLSKEVAKKEAEGSQVDELISQVRVEDFSREAVKEQTQHLAKMVVNISPEMDVAVQVCALTLCDRSPYLA